MNNSSDNLEKIVLIFIKMKILVSVIVNYHNGEKYLENCIKSIINQDYENIEIILWAAPLLLRLFQNGGLPFQVAFGRP